MYRRQAVPEPLIRLSTLQGGLVTREQAIGHGVTREMLTRLLRSGQWLRLCTGLFAVVPAPPTWETLAWGGTLLGGPCSRLGPEASGHLYGLVAEPPRPIDVLVPYSTPKRVEGPWQFVRERDGVRPTRSPGSPPRLTPECTVLDLAARRSAGDVVGLVTKAVQKGHTTPDRLRRLLAGRSRQRHRELIEGMLAEVVAGVESYLEHLYDHDVERAHKLPRGDRQTSSGDLPYRSDVRYRRFATLVELDGRIGHEDEGRFRDMDRDNRHALRAEVTLRYGYFDVSERACAVAFQVYRALVQRGYREAFVRCARCADAPESDLEAA